MFADSRIRGYKFNPLNAELNPICHLLALLGGATIVVISRLRVKGCVLQIKLFVVGLLHTTLYVFRYEYYRIGQDWKKML